MRGAWIEMTKCLSRLQILQGRSPCGERGLKYLMIKEVEFLFCRSPCGERGLKCL